MVEQLRHAPRVLRASGAQQENLGGAVYFCLEPARFNHARAGAARPGNVPRSAMYVASEQTASPSRSSARSDEGWRACLFGLQSRTAESRWWLSFVRTVDPCVPRGTAACGSWCHFMRQRKKERPHVHLHRHVHREFARTRSRCSGGAGWLSRLRAVVDGTDRTGGDARSGQGHDLAAILACLLQQPRMFWKMCCGAGVAASRALARNADLAASAAASISEVPAGHSAQAA